MSFKIIVDSCCDLTPAQLREDCFVSVPLTIRVGEHIVVDDASFDQGALLWRMKESATAPQSSCPSPIQYLEAFDCGADDLYVVTLSALLSGSHNAAAQARSLWLEDHPNSNVHIFNSCSASAGEVLVALKIQELAQSGMDFTTVVSQVSRYINEMETYFVLETLDNLRKNGRLTRVQSLVTSTLHIKLLMGATPEGEICKKGQAMSIKQALSKMVSLMAADPKHEGRRLSIVHCNCLERAFHVNEAVPFRGDPHQRYRRHQHRLCQRRRHRRGLLISIKPFRNRPEEISSGRLFFAPACAIMAKIVLGGAFMNYTIRPIGPEDAEGAAALRRMPGVFENTLGLPSYRTADSEAFIAGLGPDDHNFVAVLDDGTVIGCAGLTVCSNPRMRHVGAVGLFVHADYQGRGVGTTLMETLLDLADHWLMLVRVELEVFADNEQAIRLYEKLGFEKEGLLRMTTVRNGRYVDEYKMARIRPGVTAP